MVDATQTALLIIDMQHDCCSPGGAIDRAGGDVSRYAEIIPRIAALVDECRAAGILIIHCRMRMLPSGQSDSPAWLRLRMRMSRNFGSDDPTSHEYMVSGTWGEEFVDELRPREGDVEIAKYRSSAMVGTELDLILRSNGIESVLVAGCTTEGCVESTVRDIGMRDYTAIVLKDCVQSDVQELHEASMLVMGAYRAEMATSTEIIEFWRTRTVGQGASVDGSRGAR
jgi:nicotinamidase-related amidase